MKKYVKMIVDKMKEEKLFASQGGPIILTQVWFYCDNFPFPHRKFDHLIDFMTHNAD